jgi:drug/metabolite transporter, DME family
VPCTYSRWDDAAHAHHAAQRQNEAAAPDYTLDTTSTALVSVDVPAMVLAGELDLAGLPSPVAELVRVFPDAPLVTQSGAGQISWLDDPAFWRAVTRSRAVVYIVIAATAWGTGGAIASVLYSHSGLGALAVSCWRFVGGSVALGLAWPLLRRRESPSLLRQFTAAPVRLLVTGIGLAVYQTAYFAAVGATGVAVATVVTLGSGPILVSLGARLWMSERLGRRGVVVVAVALGSLVLLVLSGNTRGSTVSVAGIALALLSAVGYAGTTLIGRAVGRTEGGGEPVGDALIGFVVGSVGLLALTGFVGLIPLRGNVIENVGMLAYLGLVPSALAYVLFFAGLAVVNATSASVIALVEPLTAAIIAVALLGERLSVLSVVGAVGLLGAVIVLAVE